ncbi:proline dehydrogenase [Streptomyces sp. NPDC005492]|uniref:proline dehydrogenase n=1 Tax=Streptomyces sp. NPDC005492 TaxID=3156883 RepID=UPI0033AC170F
MGIVDAGLAALLGAAVGSLATVGAASVSGRATARRQFDQWLRQHRRDAYANYLSALPDRDLAMDAVLDALQPETPDLRDVNEKVRRFVALAREVHRAAEVVILEGPLSTTEAADCVARASRDLSSVMRRMVQNAHAEDSSQKAADTALASGREHALHQAVTDFHAAASSVLGNTN